MPKIKPFLLLLKYLLRKGKYNINVLYVHIRTIFVRICTGYCRKSAAYTTNKQPITNVA